VEVNPAQEDILLLKFLQVAKFLTRLEQAIDLGALGERNALHSE